MRRIDLARMIVGSLLGIMLLAVSGPASYAQDMEGGAQRTVTLKVGTPFQFQADKSFSKARVVNPDIVDAVPKTTMRLQLEPLSAGQTNILFYDQQNAVFETLHVTVSSEVLIGKSKNLRGFDVYQCGPRGCRYDHSGG